jgi:hypothetical protein
VPWSNGAAADLDHLAQRIRVAGLAHHASIGNVAVRGHPFQHAHGAVGGRPFLIAGDQQADGAGEFAGRQPGRNGGNERRYRSLHVAGAAPIEHAVVNPRVEWRKGPAAPRRHHIGMAGEAEMWRGRADPREQVFDFAEFQPGDRQAKPVQCLRQNLLRAVITRCDRLAGEKLPRERQRVGIQHPVWLERPSAKHQGDMARVGGVWVGAKAARAC